VAPGLTRTPLVRTCLGSGYLNRNIEIFKRDRKMTPKVNLLTVATFPQGGLTTVATRLTGLLPPADRRWQNPGPSAREWRFL
jgi:hypothetical protein